MFSQLGFEPIASEGCTGPPITPLPDDANEELWTKDSISVQPKEITRQLFPHQLKSIADMERFERKETITLGRSSPNPSWITQQPLGLRMSNMHDYRPDHSCQRTLIRHFGIQADPVGYGKTLSIVSLIARDKMEWDASTPMEIETTERMGLYEWKFTSTVKRVNATLIVASLSCFDQWVNDLKFAPELKVLLVKNTRSVEKYFIISNPVSNADFDYDVVICTPNFYKKVIQANPRIAWKRFIFDEPAHLRLPSMEFPLCGFLWFITATPAGIAKSQKGNWIGRLFSHIQSPYYYNYSMNSKALALFTVRNPEPFVKQSFGMPPPIVKEYFCSQPLVQGLRGLVSRDLLARIEAGDISGAIAAMGGTSSSKDNIIDVIRAKKMKRREEIVFRLGRAENESSKRDWEKKLVDIDEQLSKLEDTMEDDLKGSCMICLDDMHEPVMEPSCGKIFCGECLLTWLTHHHSCPNCRAKTPISSLVHIGEKSSAPAPDQPPTKLECMLQIFNKRLEENPKAKFILASQYSGGFRRIQHCVKNLGLKYCELKGAASTRSRMIKSFQEGDTQVVFVSTDFSNTAGVNLQSATDIIMFNTMDEATRTQIIGRANRIGRTKPVVVHTLKAC